MLIYWSMFLIPTTMALMYGKNNKSGLLPFLFVGFFFILFIGLRFRVGGDWYSYLSHYNMTIGISLSEAIMRKDPGHQALNWIMARWDLGVYGVNMVYGTVFMIGLIKFSRNQPYPWIAMSAAVPYMMIVVAMGYSRQGMALGLFMWAITYLRNGKLKTYVVLILIAILFHKSAIILLPLGMLIYGKGMILRLLMIIPLIIGVWELFVSDSQSSLLYNYIERDMQSSGAKIRVFMNFIPSLILL